MHTILLFYKYVQIAEPKKLVSEQKELCTKLGLTGRVIIAPEGINATLEGTNENIEKYLQAYLSDPRFADTHIKKSQGTGDAFPKLSVKVRKDIISNSITFDVDPNVHTGKRLSPEEFHTLLTEKKDSLHIVDMRNDYELKVGQFEGTIFPGLKNFRDLPAMKDTIADLKDKQVVTVCTGGVRCEKASGYLVKEGFKDVYQLDGGIVSYMEKYPGEHFKGSLYVFDKRKVIHFDSSKPENKHEIIGVCDKCGSKTENYVNCALETCHNHFLCCENCSEDGQELAYCGEVCKNAHLDKLSRQNQTVS
jgi:UPF0176 protein